MDLVKNYVKQNIESLLQFKHKVLYNIVYNVPLRLFLTFFIGIFLVYGAIDFLLSWGFVRTLGEYLWGPTSFSRLGEMIPFLGNLRAAPFLLQIITLMFIGGVAAIFTDVAMSPIKHAQNDQKRFVANASHELRTPLSIMKTTAEVMRIRGDKVTREEMIEFTGEIIEEVNRMSSIIEFFLRFATMENRQHFQMSAVSLSQVVNKVINILSRIAEEKGVALTFKERSAATIWGNFTALEEMFINFVKNAISHTPKGGNIMLSVKEKEDCVLAIVEDTGSGVSHEDLPHIFEPFFKGTNEAKRKGGIGLGLTIVREIAKMHQAKITVESQAGKGTSFFVKFPKH